MTEAPQQTGLATWAANAAIVGFLAAAVGVIDGIYLIVSRREATCPAGTEFPEGETDFSCFVHPQAGLGIGLISISVMLAVLLLLVTTMMSDRNRPGGPATTS